MSDFGYTGETTGYPYPRPFQPNIKARQNVRKAIAKTGKSVINKPRTKKPIVKKRGK